MKKKKKSEYAKQYEVYHFHKVAMALCGTLNSCYNIIRLYVA